MDYAVIAIGVILLVVQIVILMVTLKNKSYDDSTVVQKLIENDLKLSEINRRLDEQSTKLNDEFAKNRQENYSQLQGFQSTVVDQLKSVRSEAVTQNEHLTKVVTTELTSNREELVKSLKEINDKIIKIQEINTDNVANLNRTLSSSVERLQESNEKKLDQMRQTVDEKLTSTLTQRLDSSFKVVGEQLKDVYKSLGEMKELASGVSDLQRVLTNVKARGTWAEVQLDNILSEILTADQYEINVSPKNDSARVEFAVKIPSRDDSTKFVWLPIDSKFPVEDYYKLSDAAETGDKEGVEQAGKALETRIKKQASDIARLYLEVPKTTDFAIMFLPTEGLYAEVLRRSGLVEEIQHKHRVLICGPTTITAFLSTLRMGFKTIALDKRAAEVWKVLGAAKTQYDKFEEVLAKVKKKIDEAGSTIDLAQHRNSIIRKNLRSVEALDVNEANLVLENDVDSFADSLL